MRGRLRAIRVALSLIVPLLIRASREWSMIGDLRRRMLLRRLFVSTVAGKATRVMFVLKRSRNVSGVARRGHIVADCKSKDIVCFNCNEEGHISSQCTQPKRAPTTGRVFALTGTQTEDEDRLIRGMNIGWIESWSKRKGLGVDWMQKYED
ncbi:putative transcription factor interactor and regulator CCHC(Zn) family [Medicago truncatula]|uniref:Putative transcription factor interactor and regulator CCHC(Zn) family n=1 Tax=Medicago truncatula TaxID=3880 RepID=A0A396JF79_MEDTR|nr:putative transcription factor interactor and regulator CCHC(Zn) family [Medicago truncatula]